MIEENFRESEESFINVLIVLSNLSSDICYRNKDLYLDKNKVLDVEITKYLKDNKVDLEGEYYLYLMTNDEIIKELDKKQTVLKLGLKPNDEILISKIKLNEKKRIVINEDLSFNNDPVLDVNKKKNKKKEKYT
jgi:alkyl hydroperoxide reductase subunit AhpF